MGYMRHHAIVVTSFDGELLAKARARAASLFPSVSAVITDSVNGYSSFFVPPDGSKEGWIESDEGDKNRAIFVAWLDAQRYDDDSSSLAWVEVQYGDEEGQTRIVSDSDALRRDLEAG